MAPVNQEGHLPAVGRSHGKKGQARDSRGIAKPPIVGSRPAPHVFLGQGNPAVRCTMGMRNLQHPNDPPTEDTNACSGLALDNELEGGGGARARASSSRRTQPEDQQ